MALKIKNDPERGPGFAWLVFDRAIEKPQIEIAVYNCIRRAYLGPSVVGKVDWRSSKSHFFTARRVSGDRQSAAYRVGPEVTTFIPDGTLVEISTADDSIHEQVAWEFIDVDFSGGGVTIHISPPEDSDIERRRREEEERLQRQVEAEAERLRQQEIEAQREAERLEAERKRAEEEEKARRQKEEDRRAREEAERLERERKDKEKEKRPKPKYVAYAILAVGAVAVLYMLFAGFKARLCNEYGWFCDAETKMYREAEACAAPKTCGAMACVEPYRKSYPSGRYIPQIEIIADEKGGTCTDAEKDAFDLAVACADRSESRRAYCEVDACFADFRRQFAGSRRLAPEQARLQRTAQACLVQRERAVLDNADACATRDPCRAQICFSEYRSQFPNGLFRNDADASLARARSACRAAPAPSAPPLPSPPGARFKQRTTEAPSFNCSRVRLPVDEMICADGDIAQADGEMGQVYSRKMGTLTGPARDGLLNEQRQWIIDRNRGCSVKENPPWTIADLENVKLCLIDRTNARRREIETR